MNDHDARAAALAPRLTLGVTANEVFSTGLGRMGGFGWAVHQVVQCFGSAEDLGVDPIVMVAEPPANGTALPDAVHGAPVVWPAASTWSQIWRARAASPDLLLSIDYRSSYRRYLYSLPRVPLVVWVRDPWSPADCAQVATLRIPGAGDDEPQGVRGPDPSSLAQVSGLSRVAGRRILFATTAGDLAAKVPATYGVQPDEVGILPNIIRPASGSVRKAERPLIVFLARLDPVKRPWLFATLAERFPDAVFLVMGQAHFRGPGTWQPENLPPNVRLLGHVGEEEKRRILEQAWVLVNTSIHEGLSVSFLEALAREVPIIASVDPDSVVSRFGIFAGRAPGTGEELLPSFEASLRNLLEDRARRERLGAAGRRYVESTHTRATFLAAFAALVHRAGLELPPGLQRFAPSA